MYKKIKELYDKHEFAFNMALMQLIKVGSDNAKTITDEQIEKCEIPMFDKSLSKLYAEMLRDLGKISDEDASAIIKFAEVEKPINIIGFKRK